MLQNNAETYLSEHTDQAPAPGADRSLQIILWILWVLAVVGTGFWHWRADVLAQRPVNLLGMIIYSVLSGLVGLLVITMIELRLEPERFLD
jgi:hypothetical protein